MFVSVAGTPYYMPPEFIKTGRYDGCQATVWQLGIILEEMLPEDPEALSPGIRTKSKSLKWYLIRNHMFRDTTYSANGLICFCAFNRSDDFNKIHAKIETCWKAIIETDSEASLVHNGRGRYSSVFYISF